MMNEYGNISSCTVKFPSQLSGKNPIDLRLCGDLEIMSNLASKSPVKKKIKASIEK